MVSIERVDAMWNGNPIYRVEEVVDVYQLGQCTPALTAVAESLNVEYGYHFLSFVLS